MQITLIAIEIEELKKTAPTDRRKGGFQSFIVELSERSDANHTIDLTLKDIEKIDRYANYTQGGFQNRLKRIFGRTLGPYLTCLQSRVRK